VIGAYHRLFQIESSFRMSKHDLRARPVHHHKRESIDAHLTIVFAALAVSRWIADTTGWSIKRFVKTAHRYRTVRIRVGEHMLTAADPGPTTYATRSSRSTPARLRTKLIRLGSYRPRSGEITSPPKRRRWCKSTPLRSCSA
jgi:hypothetical protein